MVSSGAQDELLGCVRADLRTCAFAIDILWPQARVCASVCKAAAGDDDPGLRWRDVHVCGVYATAQHGSRAAARYRRDVHAVHQRRVLASARPFAFLCCP